MVARSDKRSAADLCKCGHWRSQHFSPDACSVAETPDAICPCREFRPAVHEQLTGGRR